MARRSIVLLMSCVLGALCGRAQAQLEERAVVESAADALGGRERILALKTLRVQGYGQVAYQSGGGNITSAPDAPSKWQNITGYDQTLDLANGRMQVRERLSQGFVFAAVRNMTGAEQQRALDTASGELVAFTTGADGTSTRVADATARAWRMEMLAHPVTAVRAALADGARLTNLHESDGRLVVDVATPLGDEITLALDGATRLPAWVAWVGPHENLGDLAYRTSFTAYEPVDGVLLPMAFNTVIDFRNIVQRKIYVDRNSVDRAATIVAPSRAVAAARAPVRTLAADATRLADGVWLIAGNGGANSVLFELADHLTVFEVPTSAAWTRTILDTARKTVPGKPLTHAIVSHHHFDHAGGLREAVAQGLTIVTQRGNVAHFRELVARPAQRFPDALTHNPRALETLAVDDRLTLGDGTLTVEIYRVISNSHMADAVLAYVPRDRLLIQADLFDQSWEIYFWGNTYMDNVDHRRLDVATDVPIHGAPLPLRDVRQRIAEQIANAEALCGKVVAADLSLPGCPVMTIDER